MATKRCLNGMLTTGSGHEFTERVCVLLITLGVLLLRSSASGCFWMCDLFEYSE